VFDITLRRRILLQLPTNFMTFVAMVGGIFITYHIKIRFVVLACLCIPPIGGRIGLIFVPSTSVPKLMGCYYAVYLYAGLRESARSIWIVC
jgi:hypothetical protein